MSRLTIRRDQGWADRLRAYRITLDGAAIGTIAHDEVLHHEVSSGRHVVEAKIDWCGSQPLHFTSSSNDTVVEVRSALRGWRLALGLFYVVFKRRQYLSLHLIAGSSG